jgi:hypothetical protein
MTEVGSNDEAKKDVNELGPSGFGVGFFIGSGKVGA